MRPDYFKDKPIEEVVKEAMEEKKEVEIIIEEEPVPTVEELAEQEPKKEIKITIEPEPIPTEEEFAEIEKEKKKAELKAQLEALG